MFRILSISILLSFLMASPALADEQGFFSSSWHTITSYFSDDAPSTDHQNDIDLHGNTGNTVPPTLTIPIPINIEATGLQSNIAAGVVTATDSLGNPVAVTNNAPATFPIGATVVTYTATDIYGNVSTITQTVTVVDTTPPTISIQQPAITVEATTAQSTVNLGIATAIDIVDGVITPINNAPATFPLGVTTVTWTVTDAAGNTATAQQQVTVQDTTPPVITAPVPVSGVSQDGYAVAVNIGTATATDAFTPVSITNNAPTTFPVGNTIVTWTATDTNGNSATATQLVMVTDNSIFANLPPDPVAAGKTTLAGIDSDNDGVRDDVQRWIVMTYPSSQKTRAALRQMAKALQNILLNVADVANARSYSIEEGRASDCLTYIRRQVMGAGKSDDYDIDSTIQALYLNTYIRSKAYLQYDANLSGMFFSLPSDYSTGCNFNPAVLPN